MLAVGSVQSWEFTPILWGRNRIEDARRTREGLFHTPANVHALWGAPWHHQRVRFGADAEGRLTAIGHEALIYSNDNDPLWSRRAPLPGRFIPVRTG